MARTSATQNNRNQAAFAAVFATANTAHGSANRSAPPPRLPGFILSEAAQQLAKPGAPPALQDSQGQAAPEEAAAPSQGRGGLERVGRGRDRRGGR